MRQHYLEMTVLTVAIVLIVVCLRWVLPDARRETPAEEDIHYFRDSRTGICFAQFGYTLTEVPCDLAFKEKP